MDKYNDYTYAVNIQNPEKITKSIQSLLVSVTSLNKVWNIISRRKATASRGAQTNNNPISSGLCGSYWERWTGLPIGSPQCVCRRRLKPSAEPGQGLPSVCAAPNDHIDSRSARSKCTLPTSPVDHHSRYSLRLPPPGSRGNCGPRSKGTQTIVRLLSV